MADLRRSRRMIWSFPILFIVLMSTLSVAGRWTQPKAVLKSQFQKAYGLIMNNLDTPVIRELARWLGRQEDASPSDWRQNITLPPGYTITSSGGRMLFAQVADGILPGTNRFYKTNFMLVNDSGYDASGTIEFVDDNGKPLVLTLEGQSGASFPLTVPKGTVRRLSTSGSGALKVGWAQLLTDQPITGTSSFQIRDDLGKVYGDVGVSESILGTSFTIFARYIAGTTDIGLALINPSATDTNTLKLELLDTDGTKQDETSLSLGPKAHLARFLAQLFPTKIGAAFKGTVVITSTNEKPFGGITLRITGDIMTSLPMVPPPPLNDNRTRLAFPQVADGLLGQLKYKTSVLLFNNTKNTASGAVEFFNSSGTPMNVTIDGVTAASFNYSLKPGALKWMITSGSGNAQVGWARAKMDKPLSGCGMFHVYNKQDTALAEVGIASAKPSKSFNLIADSIGFFDTGIALANPSETDDTASVKLALYDKAGNKKTESTISLAPLKHQAQFLSQIFPGFAEASEFEGLIKASSDEDIVPLSLRSVDEKLTSVPTLQVVHAFAPVSVMEFAHNESGTAPAVRWHLEQTGADLSLETMDLSVPDLGLNSSLIKPGTQLGYGYYLMNISGAGQFGGVAKLVANEAGNGSFDILASGPYLTPASIILSGKFEGSTSGGLAFHLGPAKTQNADYNLDIGFELDMLLIDGLINAPSSAKTVNLQTTYTSASIKPDEDGVRISRKTVQPQAFVTSSTTRPRILGTQPVYFSPGDLLTIKCDRFGSSPSAMFPTLGGSYASIKPVRIGADSIDVEAPPYAKAGTIWIQNGTNIGAAYQTCVLFSAEVDVKRLSKQDANPMPFSVTLQTPARQLAVQAFQLILANVDKTLSGLAAESQVGTATISGGTSTTQSQSYVIKVKSSSANQAVLQVSRSGSTSTYALITVDKISGSPSGISLKYAPAQPTETPMVNGFAQQMEFKFDSFGVTLPPSGQYSTWSAYVDSVPSAMYGQNSAIRISRSQ